MSYNQFPVTAKYDAEHHCTEIVDTMGMHMETICGPKEWGEKVARWFNEGDARDKVENPMDYECHSCHRSMDDNPTCDSCEDVICDDCIVGMPDGTHVCPDCDCDPEIQAKHRS